MSRNPSPGEPDWWVEDALNEVIEAVREGADPLEVDQETADELKERYRPDFEKQFEDGADWHQDRDGVLKLARLVGEIAMELTRECCGQFPEKPSPNKVSRPLTIFAAYIVAKMCPLRHITIRGAYCPNMRKSHKKTLAEMRSSPAPASHQRR